MRSGWFGTTTVISSTSDLEGLITKWPTPDPHALQNLLTVASRYDPRTLAPVSTAARSEASAGVVGRHHPHRWRHSYATSLVLRGEDIHVVQRLMGHSNIVTTTRYLHLSDADLLAAVDRAFPES